MATDQQLRNAGYTLPEDDSLISGGAEAIRDNADAAYEGDQSVRALLAPITEVTESGPMYRRGAIPSDQSVNDMWGMSWNGPWTISSNATNVGLPITASSAGQLVVESSGNQHSQQARYSGGLGTYERFGINGSWGAWSRVDTPFARRGSAPNGGALSSLTSGPDAGMWLIPTGGDYPDRPEATGARTPGMLLNFTYGTGVDTVQIVTYRFSEQIFYRSQTSPGNFTDWQEFGTSSGGNGGGGTDVHYLEERLRLLELSTRPAQTPFEHTRRFSTFEEGDAYMDWLAGHYPDKVNIVELGESRQGRPLRAFEFGDPTKPTFYLMASQHGNEPMGHESALIWARDLCEDTSPELAALLDDACIVILPVVNADRINDTRLDANGNDLNRNWDRRTIGEVQAAAKPFADYDVVLCIDSHEGGTSTHMMGAITTNTAAPASLRAINQQLYDHVEAGYVTASEPYQLWDWDDAVGTARHEIPVRDKAAQITFECPSLLSTNMYYPSVVWRDRLNRLAYDLCLEHFRLHLTDYVSAKNAAL
ncbi:MAG TPA: M14 family zinc carboxypeptidase [Guyparkeria sp.]|nr:M14 family zinc carboxypeptidase [Guyparkeria sp.]